MYGNVHLGINKNIKRTDSSYLTLLPWPLVISFFRIFYLCILRKATSFFICVTTLLILFAFRI